MDKIPHQAVVAISIYIHQVLPNGQCDPRVVKKEDRLLTFTGISVDDVYTQVDTFLKGNKTNGSSQTE